jgi:group I intron endonuclease
MGQYQRKVESKKSYGVIYLAKNLVNDKIYVGQTTIGLAARISAHFNSSRCKNDYSEAFHNALSKYGRQSFVWEQLDEAVSQQELDEKEKLWISRLSSLSPEGYNIRDGGGGGGRLPEEIKLRISQKKKGSPAWNKGVSPSEETRKKISKSRKGQPSPRKGVKLSKEIRKKMSETRKKGFRDGTISNDGAAISRALKGRVSWNKGIKQTPEAKRKISKSLMGNQHTLGMKQSKETKLKISASLRKTWKRRKQEKKDVNNQDSLRSHT